MDNSTATHPPCPMCDPSILPEGYDPLPLKGVMVRPDGSTAMLRGACKVYWNGIDVTNQAAEVDLERGVIVAYHRAFGPAFISRIDYDRGVRSADKPPEMGRHVCNRDALDRFDPGLGGGHACAMVLLGEVVVIDKVTGKAPVFVEPVSA